MHHPNEPITREPPAARCLRHHVWMAACVDCRDARTLPPRPRGTTRN